jgi:hypothetical protein
MPTVGNVTMGPGVTLTCPEASSFADTAGGLYGFASYAVQCPFCNSSLYNLVLASTLQFTCTPCAEGLYSLRAGHSNGSPGVAVNYPCLACPQGGLCTGGTVVATPGYWGQPDGNDTVTFAVCPAGYCCTGDGRWPCSAAAVCGGNRGGVLCGACAPGYVESLGSAQCAPVADCGRTGTIRCCMLAWGVCVSMRGVEEAGFRRVRCFMFFSLKEEC